MKTAGWMVALMLAAGTVSAGDAVSVPWDEFKQLYRESIERDVMKKNPTAGTEKPFVYTLDEAVYTLSVGQKSSEGQALISGRVVSGSPEAIPLFSQGLVVTGIRQVTGGSLLCGDGEGEGISFLPGGSNFQLVVSFLCAPQADARSRVVSVGIPAALKNSLTLTLAPDTQLVEAPGVADREGIHHFPSSGSLTVRYMDRQELSAQSVVEVDTFTRLRFADRRLVMATTVVPIQPLPPGAVLQAPEGARFLSSSLKSSWIRKADDGSYLLDVPRDEKGAFTIEFAVDDFCREGDASFRLPFFRKNSRKEAAFIMEEPDDAQITLTGTGLVTRIPVARLAEALKAAAGQDRMYMQIQPEETLRLKLARFQSVSTPALVLDSMAFFAAFEENGNTLSVLTMELPPDAGPRLGVKAVADAEIWSLSVNGIKKRVFAGSDQTWILPLAEGAVSRVELAYLKKGDKLGLQGKLEAELPETGLAARNVAVGLALPQRVDLMSVEGPVSSDPKAAWKTPAEFVGKPYFFSRAFYKGEGMKLAVSYKQPVDDKTKTTNTNKED